LVLVLVVLHIEVDIEVVGEHTEGEEEAG